MARISPATAEHEWSSLLIEDEGVLVELDVLVSTSILPVHRM